MKASTFFLLLLAFLAGMGLILILQPDRLPQPPQIIVEIDTIQGDSIPYEVEVPVPVPVASVQDTEWMFHPVDTAAILADYNTRKVYQDTLKNDTSALIVLGEAIFQNQIVDRSLVFQNRRPIAINTTILNPPANPKWALLAGLTAGSRKGEAILGPAAGVISPNQSVVTYSYDVLHDGHIVTLVCNPFRRQKVPP